MVKIENDGVCLFVLSVIHVHCALFHLQVNATQSEETCVFHCALSARKSSCRSKHAVEDAMTFLEGLQSFLVSVVGSSSEEQCIGNAFLLFNIFKNFRTPPFDWSSVGGEMRCH